MVRHLTLATLLFVGACASHDIAPLENQPAPAPEIANLTAVIPMTSAPLDRTQALTRIAFGSCLKQEDDQSIWNTLLASDPELFLFIGDNVYGDIWSGDPNMGELREAYATLAQSAPFAAFRAATPVWATWDDHDYGLNDAGADFALRYGTEALFEEAWALPADDPRRTRDGVYHAEIVGEPGQRVQIIMLDTRFFRSDLLPTDERNAPGRERYVPDTTPDKTMLGEEQYDWLLAELDKPAELRIIVSSIQVIADGHGWEAWRTLPAERQRLYDIISSSGAEGVVMISGDRHAGGIYRRDDVLPYPLVEVTSSSLNAPASIWRAQSGETRVEDGPHRLGGMEYGVNFGMVEVDWESRSVSLELRGEVGETLQSIALDLDDLVYRD